MIRCTVNPSHIYRDESGSYGAGSIVVLPDNEAKRLKSEGVLHFEDPPQPKKEIEVKEEE